MFKNFSKVARLAAPVCLFSMTILGCETTRLGNIQFGSLPRPGLFTFFKLADTSNLLPRTDAAITDNRPFPKRGILYTKRAGFLDLAHIYNTVLLADEASGTVASGLRLRQHSIQLRSFDDSDVTITFSSPPIDPGSSSVDTEQGIQTAARFAGECVAYDLWTWHEIITWFGYETTGIWTEKPSAFTYEDTISNLVGVQVFDAISGEPNASKIGIALRGVLSDLGLVDRKLASKAVKSVKGRWWGPKLYIRRMLDIGGKDGLVNPWLVPGTQDDLHDGNAQAFTVPCKRVPGRYSLLITPSRTLLHRIRKAVPSSPAVIDPEAEFPVLVEVVRREVKRELGETATQPD
jgi:hypothetical protein